MFSRVIAGSALLIPLLLLAEPASAQRVSADIRIGGGPIAGHIRIGPDRSYGYRDYRPRLVRVEVLRARDYYRRSGWLKQFRRDARVYEVYYDRRSDFYYDRHRQGLVEIRVFQRGGHFYRWDDPRFDRWVRDRWNDGRFDDRYNDRYDSRNDDRYDRRDGRDGRDRNDGRDRRDNRDWGRRPGR